MRHLKKPSPAMIVACLSLFVALSGVTYAATGGNFILGRSNTASNQTSLSASVSSATPGGSKVLQLTNPSTASGAAGLGITVGANKAPIAVNATAGKATNLNADKLDGLDSTAFANAAQPAGRKITGSCNPTSTAFVDCGTLTINLPRPGLRVLIVASADWHSVGSAPGLATDGRCRIGVNGAPFGPDARPGETEDVSDDLATHSLTLTNVTDPTLGAGNHTFGLACNELDGDIFFDATMVSAVVLGSG
jgi:hypothetical protein